MTNTPKDLSSLLDPILKKSKLPALAGGVLIGDEIKGQGVVGLRKLGDPTPAAIHDRFHIGSCTKMFTATVAAALIEDGGLDWQTTVGGILGETISEIHSDYESVTLEQLLAHTGGLPGNPPRKLWDQAWKNQGKMDPMRQRLEFVSDLLKERPKYRPGKKTVYSNQGYAVAGTMLEAITGEAWEDLIRDRIFRPLDMESGGFRAPKGAHPQGHRGKQPINPESEQSDNPDAIGPAGTIHVSVPDLLKFAGMHLQKRKGAVLKNAESFEKLHRTLPKSKKHGVGGWLVHHIPWFGGYCLQMVGSNTMWFTIFWILPAYDMAIVVTTNSAPFSAFGTCDKAVAAILKEYQK